MAMEKKMAGTISRRTLLKSMVAAVASAASMVPCRDSSAHDFQGYESNRGVLVDLTRCIGCRSCESACSREHGLAPPEGLKENYQVLDQLVQERRRPDHRAYTVVNQIDSPLFDHPLFKKTQCNHCLEPACLTSCFVNAYTKTPEGAVIYNGDVCVGCRSCMVACPFSIPAFNYHSAFEGRIMKCNFCFDSRLSKGQPPACVEACPMEALTFGNRNELLRVARKRLRDFPGRYHQAVYGEFEAGGTSWLYLSPLPFEKAGFDTRVPRQPILHFVKDFLAVVPMVLTIWPGLFAGIYLLTRAHRTTEDTPAQEEKSDEISAR